MQQAQPDEFQKPIVPGTGVHMILPKGSFGPRPFHYRTGQETVSSSATLNCGKGHFKQHMPLAATQQALQKLCRCCTCSAVDSRRSALSMRRIDLLRACATRICHTHIATSGSTNNLSIAQLTASVANDAIQQWKGNHCLTSALSLVSNYFDSSSTKLKHCHCSGNSSKKLLGWS